MHNLLDRGSTPGPVTLESVPDSVGITDSCVRRNEYFICVDVDHEMNMNVGGPEMI